MRTVVIEVKSLEETFAHDRAILASGKADPYSRISFVSWELLHKMLTPNRMAVLQTLTGAGPVSIRELARRVGRDFKGVHTDVAALAQSGLVSRTADGGVEFPYDALRVEFDLSSAA